MEIWKYYYIGQCVQYHSEIYFFGFNEYFQNYDISQNHLYASIQMPLFWIRILEALFCSVNVINTSRVTCINFQEQDFMQCFQEQQD